MLVMVSLRCFALADADADADAAENSVTTVLLEPPETKRLLAVRPKMRASHPAAARSLRSQPGR